MNEHIRCGKPKSSFIRLNAVDLCLLHMCALFLSAAVVERRREGADEERAASAARIKNDRMAVHANDCAHEVDDVVWRERLVFV